MHLPISQEVSACAVVAGWLWETMPGPLHVRMAEEKNEATAGPKINVSYLYHRPNPCKIKDTETSLQLLFWKKYIRPQRSSKPETRISFYGNVSRVLPGQL